MTCSHDSIHSREGAPKGQEKPEAPQQQQEEKLRTILSLQSDTKTLLSRIEAILDDKSCKRDYMFQSGYPIPEKIANLKKRWYNFPKGIELDEVLDDELRNLRDQMEESASEVQRRRAVWMAKKAGGVYKTDWRQRGGSFMGYKDPETARSISDKLPSFLRLLLLPNSKATYDSSFALADAPFDVEAASNFAFTFMGYKDPETARSILDRLPSFLSLLLRPNSKATYDSSFALADPNFSFTKTTAPELPPSSKEP